MTADYEFDVKLCTATSYPFLDLLLRIVQNWFVSTTGWIALLGEHDSADIGGVPPRRRPIGSDIDKIGPVQPRCVLWGLGETELTD